MMRKRSNLDGMLAVAVITAVGGCMSPWPMGSSASNSVSVVREASTLSPTEQSASSAPLESLEPGVDNEPKTQDEAMAAVLDDLQKISDVDPVAEQELRADLRGAEPEHWPRMVKQFQSALAYRQQLAARESQSVAAQSASPDIAQTSSARTASVYATQKNSAAESTSNVPATSSTKDVLKFSAAELSRETLLAKTSPQSTQLLPSPTTALIDRNMTALAASKSPAIEQASYAASVVGASSSEEHLQAAITSLEQSTQESPSNVEEVQQHMRLRLLRLLAGQESEAVHPIPGASSTQQDYWSKQLFAISTYLDSERQPDTKRRATGSLMHLDSARASLAELATLHVRHLTFVDSIDGYGVYKEREATKFKPGEQVTLYAEVENFRSESTKEGFRTQLSTSYEVLDQSGQRVESAQFPDIEDLCKNPRRDFHMQYGVALPTRIYAGQYELQLTITDQLSHKIGQTSVPFEIVE